MGTRQGSTAPAVPEQVADQVPAFVAGEPLACPETFEDTDPSTGRHLADVARCGPQEVDRAVAAARDAFRSSWRDTSPRERSELLHRLAALVRRDREDLAMLESVDTGKPLRQARADVDIAARYFQFYGSTVEAFHGRAIPLAADLHAYTRPEPHGVTGHITAWNYPVQLFARGVAPSVAAGNCAVVKPAEEAPLSTLRLARLATEAGFPAGVVNVVPGLGEQAGAALAAHPGIDHLSFVGSTEVGALVATAAGRNVVPVTLELGGKSPHLVFPDADVEAAVTAVTAGILQNAGQTCSAGSRLLVHERVHDEVVSRVAARFLEVRLGAGPDDPDLGPLISARQRERVAERVASAAHGHVVVGGTMPDDPDLAGGHYYPPTLLCRVPPADAIAREEVFGPVLVTGSFGDAEEAVALANGTGYGLVAAVWTRDVGLVHRAARDLDAGQVYVNTYGAGGGVELPFGGTGRSGYGREKGFQALAAFTRTKTVAVRL